MIEDTFAAPTLQDSPWENPQQLIQTAQVNQTLNPAGRYADAVSMTQGMDRDMKQLAHQAKVVGELLSTDAYYSWKQGGQHIEGATVALANALRTEYRALATSCDIVSDEGNKVHLRARAIDLVNGVYEERDFFMNRRPAPGKFARKPEERDRWDTLQMQVAQSKAIRNCILRILPAWMVNTAIRAAKDAASNSALRGKPLDEVRDQVIKAFKDSGWSKDLLIEHAGQPVESWCLDEIVKLRELYRQVQLGEIQAPALDTKKKKK